MLRRRRSKVECFMGGILVINSSAAREGSVSRALVEDAVQPLLEASPDAVVTRRDLGDGHIQHLTPETASAIRAVAQTDDELRTMALSDELIAELRAADVLVLGAPMYNFSIPSSLRAWFDHVLRPRVTFAYRESGPQGLLNGLRAIVIQSRGGVYTEGPNCVREGLAPIPRRRLSAPHGPDVSPGRERRSKVTVVTHSWFMMLRYLLHSSGSPGISRSHCCSPSSGCCSTASFFRK